MERRVNTNVENLLTSLQTKSSGICDNLFLFFSITVYRIGLLLTCISISCLTFVRQMYTTIIIERNFKPYRQLFDGKLLAKTQLS